MKSTFNEINLPHLLPASGSQYHSTEGDRLVCFSAGKRKKSRSFSLGCRLTTYNSLKPSESKPSL